MWTLQTPAPASPYCWWKLEGELEECSWEHSAAGAVVPQDNKERQREDMDSTAQWGSESRDRAQGILEADSTAEAGTERRVR